MYEFYGLNFKSDLDLSSIGCPNNEDGDYQIKVTIKDNLLDSPKHEYCIGEKLSYFYKENIALFEVVEGVEINIYPSKNYSTLLAAETFLNFPLALCMSQRGYLVLHASSAYKDDICVTFSGKSHSGKSTLAYGFKKNGWTIR